MIKSLVLHIGDPKTGSSSIQEALRAGLFHSPEVKVDSPPQLNSFPLANALSDPKQAQFRAPRFTKLAAFLASSDADVGVVSAEQFFRVEPSDLLAALQEFLPDLAPSARVIAYVRPHASRLVSAYMQRVKAGLAQGDLATFFQRSQGENLLTYAPRFHKWREVFGDRFTLRPMVRAQLRNGDVVDDFLNLVVQGKPCVMAARMETNSSLPLEFLSGLREVQLVMREKAILSGTCHMLGEHLNRTLSAAYPNLGTKLAIHQSLYETLRKRCKADADELDADFFESPILSDALEQAAKTAVPVSQDIKAAAHFSDDEIAHLRAKSSILAEVLQDRPGAWVKFFEHEIGQRVDPMGPGPQLVAHVKRVNGLLAEIAGLIAAPVARKKA